MGNRPQGTPRGLLHKQTIAVGSDGGLYAHNYSTGTAVMTVESTGTVNFAGSISISGSEEDIAQDSTGVDLPGTLTLSGKAGYDITQTAASLLIPGSLSMLSAVGATAIVISANSTGLLIVTDQIATG